MTDKHSCQGCATPLDFAVTMAFQPILEARSGTIFGHEALVRGVNGEGAGAILSRVTSENRYAFDQTCRVTAVELAAELGLTKDQYLSINFLPNAVYQPETCIRMTLAACDRVGLPPEQLMFEVTENEQVIDKAHLKAILQEYKARGFLTAIDDFGAGYSGLDLLVDFQPDIIKLDMVLIRGISEDRARRAVVKNIMGMAQDLGVRTLAEGIETEAEFQVLRDLGVDYAQGYLFAKPAFRALLGSEAIHWPG